MYKTYPYYLPQLNLPSNTNLGHIPILLAQCICVIISNGIFLSACVLLPAITFVSLSSLIMFSANKKGRDIFYNTDLNLLLLKNVHTHHYMQSALSCIILSHTVSTFCFHGSNDNILRLASCLGHLSTTVNIWFSHQEQKITCGIPTYLSKHRFHRLQCFTG